MRVSVAIVSSLVGGAIGGLIFALGVGTGRYSAADLRDAGADPAAVVFDALKAAARPDRSHRLERMLDEIGLIERPQPTSSIPAKK